MNGNEFIKKTRRIARKQGLSFSFVKGDGKGSHGALYLGDKRTTLKDRKKEIGPGLLGAMCKQLGIDRRDL
jgi:mRNA interferase HicA